MNFPPYKKNKVKILTFKLREFFRNLIYYSKAKLCGSFPSRRQIFRLGNVTIQRQIFSVVISFGISHKTPTSKKPRKSHKNLKRLEFFLENMLSSYHLQPPTTNISESIISDCKEEKFFITQVNFLSAFSFPIDLVDES